MLSVDSMVLFVDSNETQMSNPQHRHWSSNSGCHSRNRPTCTLQQSRKDWLQLGSIVSRKVSDPYKRWFLARETGPHCCNPPKHTKFYAPNSTRPNHLWQPTLWCSCIWSWHVHFWHQTSLDSGNCQTVYTSMDLNFVIPQSVVKIPKNSPALPRVQLSALINKGRSYHRLWHYPSRSSGSLRLLRSWWWMTPSYCWTGPPISLASRSMRFRSPANQLMALPRSKTKAKKLTGSSKKSCQL